MKPIEIVAQVIGIVAMAFIGFYCPLSACFATTKPKTRNRKLKK